ncbi:hypothetical protein ACJX0J_033904, partial [Zea mays]
LITLGIMLDKACDRILNRTIQGRIMLQLWSKRPSFPTTTSIKGNTIKLGGIRRTRILGNGLVAKSKEKIPTRLLRGRLPEEINTIFLVFHYFSSIHIGLDL